MLHSKLLIADQIETRIGGQPFGGEVQLQKISVKWAIGGELWVLKMPKTSIRIHVIYLYIWGHNFPQNYSPLNAIFLLLVKLNRDWTPGTVNCWPLLTFCHMVGNQGRLEALGARVFHTNMYMQCILSRLKYFKGSLHPSYGPFNGNFLQSYFAPKRLSIHASWILIRD